MELDSLLDKIRATVVRHEVGDGAYARWAWEREDEPRKMGSNEYGCADAANILYILGDMPRDTKTREERVKALQAFQDPQTGLFHEGTHHVYHCTAHCISALELFDRQPEYPISGLDGFKTKEGLEGLLKNLDWNGKAWSEAHQGAGVFAAMILTGNATPQWQDWYFDWLDSHTDGQYGMSLSGAIQTGIRPACEHLNGWFHYLFNYHFAHRPFPRIRQLIDTCIDLYRQDNLSDAFGKLVGFREIDWVFTLNRATMQCGYRREEAIELLRDFASKYIPHLQTIDTETDERWNDLHMLFGTVCAIAELQIALPGELRSKFPLKQILDRRPFI